MRISSWRQYEEVNIDFDRRVTIITGSNGSGKTTIINLIGGMIGSGATFGSVPEIDKITGTTVYKIFTARNKRSQQDVQTNIGFIGMSDGTFSQMYANESNAAQYGVTYN
jgi:recombinational DNA repair ATPase RecF